MRRIKTLFAVILLLPAGLFAYMLWASYLTDDFDVYLAAMGYNSLHPPLNEFRLGSLYDIDDNGNLDLICVATATMSEESGGPASQNIDSTRTGSFSVLGNVAERLNATFGDEYSKKVRLRLSDIRVAQIPASRDGEIQEALIKEAPCRRAVIRRLRLGHYICQVEASFSANAVYEIDASASTSATAKENPAGGAPSMDNVKRTLTEAVRADTQAQATESGNSVLTGDLVFGVKLEPVCISPLNAIFVRSWHRSVVGRGIDFVKYEMIEPLFVKNLFGDETEAAVASQ
jgi:hypothetical protein